MAMVETREKLKLHHQTEKATDAFSAVSDKNTGK
jgi:hypothetical protein